MKNGSSTLPSPVPDYSPQHQQRAKNVQRALVKRTKVRAGKMFQKIAVVGVIALVASFIYASHKAPRPAPPQTQTYTTAVLKCPTHVSASVPQHHASSRQPARVRITRRVGSPRPLSRPPAIGPRFRRRS